MDEKNNEAYDDSKADPTEKEVNEMEELKLLTRKVSEDNKSWDDSYDERLRRLELKKKLAPESEEAEEDHRAKIQGLREEYDELKSRISSARRAGKDPIIADLYSRQIPSKIKMAEVTHEKKDIDTARLCIKRSMDELEEAEKEVAINIKKELEHKLREQLQRETGKVAEDED